jgi:hypothetical protein
MTQKKMIDIVDMFNTFQRDVLENKPTFTQMYNEIRMMNFKIRPLQGDLSVLDFKNTQFIETLWSLGKLDEFFQYHVQHVGERQKTTFYRLFDEMYETYQSDLNAINMKTEEVTRSAGSGFELEIFKERRDRKLN